VVIATNLSDSSARSGAAKNPFLQIKHVVKQFGDVAAVDDVSLDVHKGEIFALLGSSGCGKSTLLRMLAGFDKPTSGQILLEGQDIVGLAPYERPMNMMFQSYALFPHLSVWDNIAFGLRREGMPKPEIEQRVGQMLDLVQLKNYAKRKPHQLSGGQQQRVALARSLAKRPKLLLLDEPLGALDKKLREQTQIELVNIIKQVGVTCVMVTHDQEEAMTMSSRVAVMTEGRFMQVGCPSDVYETPSSKFVADFIGNINLFKGILDVDMPDHVVIRSAECLHYVAHGITGTEGMEVAVGVRPEKLNVTRHRPDTEYNLCEGKLESMGYYGAFTAYHVSLASGLKIKATVANTERHSEHEEMRVGDTVYAHWANTAMVVFTQ
jgi:putrescine transport system ATP-binding protein